MNSFFFATTLRRPFFLLTIILMHFLGVFFCCRRCKKIFGHCRYIHHVEVAVKPGAIYVDSDNTKGKWRIKNRKVGMCSPLSTLTSHVILFRNSPSVLRYEDAIFVALVLAIFNKQKSKLQKYFEFWECT